MKVLSVIIPAYNCENVIDKCITSFLSAPCFEKIELIVVNDGSVDTTADIVEAYCEKYPSNIKLITQENKGHGGALNTGCAAATGRYLKVIDADDWVITENLDAFINFLETAQSDVVLTHHFTTDISSGEIKKWKSYPKKFGVEYTFEDVMREWKNFERSLTFHGITYKTEFYKANGILLSEHIFYEDHEFATIPCCFAKSITPLDLFIYNYRIGDVSQSVSDENQLKRISHTEAVLERLIKELSVIDNLTNAAEYYYCMKIQGVLISYLVTALLVERNKAKGRRYAVDMVKFVKNALPEVYSLSKKQYLILRVLNLLRINKKSFEAFLNSKIYNKLRAKHDF